MYIWIFLLSKALKKYKAFSCEQAGLTLLRLCLQVLKSQSQVYLPINNDLSQHGHVAAFLEQVSFWIDFVSLRPN